MPVNSGLRPFIRPVAHRGLHDASRHVIENSVPAFEAAISAGYAIECDLRPLADGTPVVFHDATVERLTGRAGRLADLKTDDVAQLRLTGTQAGVPTLADLLQTVDARVPLLIEIKSEWDASDPRFLDRIAAALVDYAGPVALMSFDPEVLRAMRRALPGVPRGIISGRYEPPGWWSDRLDARRRAILSDLGDLDGTASDFIAYCVDHLPNPAVRDARARGLGVFAWTVRTEDQAERAAAHADAPIFELPVRP